MAIDLPSQDLPRLTMGLAGLRRDRALQRLAGHFAGTGLDTPAADARLLMTHALDLSKLALVTDGGAIVSEAEAQRIETLALRRLAHEPVSRIIGERWFYGRSFKITPDTLDPRPESETVIETVLMLVREMGLPNDRLRILDIGTGTGCLLLTLLAELPGAHGVGVDISAAALRVAADNVDRMKVSPSRVEWRCGDGFSPVAGMTFNIIVSNPPYIPTSEIPNLEPDVRHFDPHVALDGGVDGLLFYRVIANGLKHYLSSGCAVFEVGSGQAPAVADLLRVAFSPKRIEIRMVGDLGGVQRCVAASTLNLD